jgi:cytoskeletal protein CcmA (bactofilin family)
MLRPYKERHIFKGGRTPMKFWTSLIVLCVCVGIASKVHAATFLDGDHVTIEKSKVIDDDVYIFAGNATIEGTVKGDVFIFGGNARVAGKVGHSLTVFAGNVEVDGEVGWSVRVFTGSYRMKGNVGHDLMIFGGQVEAERESKIHGSVFAGAGQARLEGDVDKNVGGGAGDVTIGGVVGRNVNVEVDQLTLLPEAHVKGDLIYKSRKPANIRDGAKVDGKTERRQPKEDRGPQPVPRKGPSALFFLWSLLSAMVVAMLFLAAAPRFSQRVSDTIKERPWASLGLGIATLATVPLICFIVLITVVGIPLSLIAGVLYVISIYVSPMFVGLLIGQLILQWGNRDEGSKPSLFLSLPLGLVLLHIVWQFPLFIGWLVYLLSMITGLGALAWTLWKRPSSPSPVDLKASLGGP